MSKIAYFDNQCEVTIIMPVHNEEEFIERSLGMVLAQDYPAEQIEILVADGRSTDGTRAIVERLQIKHRNLYLIDNPGQIVPTGLNVAIPQARGDIIIRVDGHCEIAPDYVRRCVEHLQNGGVDGVGGAIETVGRTPVAQTIALAMSSSFGVGGSAFRTTREATLLTDTVPFAAYTREILQKAGPYDEELVRNQDDEFNYRLRKLGAKILLAADVESCYYSRSTVPSLWRQYYQYGYWKVRVLQKHPQQMQLRQFVPPAFVTALLGSALLALILGWAGWLFGLVAGPYLLANLLASIRLARREGWRHLVLLPLVFTILHVSYGLGFLVGLLKFWNRWGDKGPKYQPPAGSRIETNFEPSDS